ncbi:MAG: protein DpdJ [Bryobacteraceae bacterium]
MPVSATAIEFLGDLEKAELELLHWGVLDGAFEESEIEQRAGAFLARRQLQGQTPEFVDGWQLAEALLDARLLWRIPGTHRYRTRMAEAVRLFARLRQIFPDARNQAWRSSPTLVADYRLQIRPRLYPEREVSAEALMESIARGLSLLPVQRDVLTALSQGRLLRQFQSRATDRILRMAREARPSGTIVSAGTGSGKTLAFYLPCFAAMVPYLSREFWTKCIAIYPRSELLKDQMREALANTKRITRSLVASRKRRITIGALYQDVPYNAEAVSTHASWPVFMAKGRRAYECPLIRCPQCNGKLAWLASDVSSETERLECSECEMTVDADELRLTRVRMLREPPDLLFTSTEMLNQRLSSARYSALFGVGLRAERRPMFVLVDEVHAYEGVHGAQVAFLLRRWRRASESACHFVGLSATLADAPRFFADLVGLGPGDVAEIAPDPGELREEGAEYLLALRGDPGSGTSLLSTSIQSLMLLRRILEPGARTDFGHRVFGFTDNLDVINRLYHSLLDAEGWTPFGRPNPQRQLGSLANLRASTMPAASERLLYGQNWELVEDIGNSLSFGSRVRIGRTSSQDAGVNSDADVVVATSALEVGFDDPEVGAVLQHKAPLSAASFLQRKGRAGRRATMRPWTVVVLSDYGRDRAAYQAYDYLFSPVLQVRHLPISNRAVQKMQAVFVVFEWLAGRLTRGEANPWSDFSQPSTTNDDRARAAAVRERQLRYAAEIRSLLEVPGVRQELAKFIGRSLALSEPDVTALFWEAPRSLMTEVLPTLLRRLERDWQRADGSGHEQFIPWSPLPEFVPRALFSDLQLPELSIRIPEQQPGQFRVELMPVAQGLREFAPGRVSRRFGVRHGRQRYWINPGPNAEVLIDDFCSSAARQDLGLFRYVDNGAVSNIRVFRPFVIDTSLPPADIQQSSNSFLHWRTEVVWAAPGESLDLPARSHWRSVIQAVRIHTHQLGAPVELRRFAIGATTHIARRRGQSESRQITFSTTPSTATIPAALGFVADVDAVKIEFLHPTNLRELLAEDAALVRALRVERFHDLIRGTPALEGLANMFQREWLSHVYLSNVIVEAVLGDITLESAEEGVFSKQSKAPLEDVLLTMFQPGGAFEAEEYDSAEEDEDDTDESVGDKPTDAHTDVPRRYKELADLLGNTDVLNILHHAAPALWQTLDESWDSWLREHYKATLGAAFFEAVQRICPRTTVDALNLELTAMQTWDAPDAATHAAADVFWITESTLGGSGFVEEFLARFSEDPRRFFRFLDAALYPSDLEVAADDLGRIVEFLASDSSTLAPVQEAVSRARLADSHEQSTAALKSLRAELSRTGVLPNPTLMISLNARLLRPGFTRTADLVMHRLLRSWRSEEQRLGIDIDARVFAFVKSFDQQIDTLVEGSDGGRSWRYGVLLGLLWARGAQIRAESLKIQNLFERPVRCDRLVVRAANSDRAARVQLERNDWFSQITECLANDGIADLCCPVSNSAVLAGALRDITVLPIDSGPVLTYARLTAVLRDQAVLTARLELPEAWQ